MSLNANSNSPSNLSFLIAGLLSGIFTMGLLYMVDWKQDSIHSIYYYLVGAIFIAVFSAVAQRLFSRFGKKQGKDNSDK